MRQMTLEQTVTKAMRAANVPGFALAVIEDGQLSSVDGFGTRNSVDPGRVDADTVFAVASLSKPPFAQLVLKLAARGLLDLDRPLAELHPRPYNAYGLDPKDDRLARITPRQVLCHTSGLGNWAQADTGRISFEPGTRWQYSGEGYLYLQRVVEQLSGTPLETLAERELFQPLGLRLSSYVWREDWTNLAVGHGVSSTGGDRFERAFSAFSLHTTAAEYGALTVSGMRDPSASAMFERATDMDDVFGWGLGMGLVEDVFWHWGELRRLPIRSCRISRTRLRDGLPDEFRARSRRLRRGCSQPARQQVREANSSGDRTPVVKACLLGECRRGCPRL